jgi:PHD/YefM family antitoxin component YafN of YafNO toxin-antitoxin module
MATAREEYIVDSKGRKKAIILPIKKYEKLMEDLYDLGLMDACRDEPSTPLEEVERRLREDGILQG